MSVAHPGRNLAAAVVRQTLIICIACAVGTLCGSLAGWCLIAALPIWYGLAPPQNIAAAIVRVLLDAEDRPLVLRAASCILFVTSAVLSTILVAGLLRSRFGGRCPIVRCLSCGAPLTGLREPSCPVCKTRIGESGKTVISTQHSRHWRIWMPTYALGIVASLALYFGIAVTIRPGGFGAALDDLSPYGMLRVWSELRLVGYAGPIGLNGWLLLSILVSAGYVLLSETHYRRTLSCRCPRCGYNLRGIAAPRCPECGRSI